MPADPKRAEAFTLIELMIVVAILAIIIAVAIPSLVNARIAANEGSAISSLKTILTSNEQYNTRYHEYAEFLSDLGDTGYIDSLLAAGTKSGYVFNYVGNINDWNIVAAPEISGQTGHRSFYVDQSGVIRWEPSGIANAASPALGD
jgi:type IV pilus assembly protein PilA